MTAARHPRIRRALLVVGIVLAVLVGYAALAGFFGRDPIRVFPPRAAERPLTALLFSGDAGLRFGMGPRVAAALADRGLRVTGFTSPTVFRLHRTRAEVDATVAAAVRRALAAERGARLVAIGQSYGADILQTGLADLPAALRSRIAGVILIVPGETVFFRADPSGLAYRGTPDGRGIDTARTLTWAPVTCIYGVAETDSLCPHLRLRGQRVIGMPGGHFLGGDADALVANVVAAVRRAAPQAFQTAA